MKAPELYGLVLIGGNSTRMGVDKSLINYHEKDQRQHSYQLLSKYCSRVFLSCNKDQSVNVDLPYIVDSNDFKGPLAGLYSAQEKFQNVAWLVLACDMPYINDTVLEMLIKHRDPTKMATCFYHDFPEPLCTIWEPSSHAALGEYMSSGNLRPVRFLENSVVEYIRIDTSVKDLLRNINTPEEKIKHQAPTDNNGNI